MNHWRRRGLMKLIFARFSVIFGIGAALLVFTPFFKTPPIPIALFSLFGIVTGMVSVKEHRNLAIVGIALSVISFLYLTYLFIQLGG